MDTTQTTPSPEAPVLTGRNFNPGFFKPGNKYSKGRPKNSKSQIEIIRRRILMVVQRRIMHEKDLSSVSTTDLIKFLGTIMPKDLSLGFQRPQVTYISNVPRDSITDQVQPTATEVLETKIVDTTETTPTETTADACREDSVV